MAEPTRSFQIPLAVALDLGAPPPGNLAVPVFRHGSLVVELYQPRGEDRQTPHRRDETYVVVRGSGRFFDGLASRPVGPGHLLFVPAGQIHRFEEFTSDFAVWVMFHGPDGGELVADVAAMGVRARIAETSSELGFRLVACDVAGNPSEPLGHLSDDLAEGCRAGAGLYWKKGFLSPWIGYVAVEGGVPVGLGAFTGPPVGDEVEIAYYTRPEFQGRGIATRTAARLTAIARSAAPSLAVIAHTLPVEGPSPHLLRKLGFRWMGAIDHPEDGWVWKWRA